jgi:hypothetical protein
VRSHGQNDLWQLAADLAKKNFKPEFLEQIFAALDADTARAALVRISSSVEIADLLNQIESSTSRISDLVGAIKEYTFMDQAPIQNVDIVKTLETTLTIMNHQTQARRDRCADYQKIPLLVNSFRERIESGLDQPHRQRDRRDGRKRGELRVRTYREALCRGEKSATTVQEFRLKSEPHILSPSSRPRLWEGTGLGLDTVQRIVKNTAAASGAVRTWRHAFSGVATVGTLPDSSMLL